MYASSSSSSFLPAKAQKVEMDKLEKAKKERTKVNPTTTKKVDYFHQLHFISNASFITHVQKQTLPGSALVTATQAQPSAALQPGTAQFFMSFHADILKFA